MDPIALSLVLTIGYALIAGQGLAAYADGYLSRAQMKRKGYDRGYSLVEHGGAWADVLLITPLCAYLAGAYALRYASPAGYIALAGALGASAVSMIIHRHKGTYAPGPHARYGKTTIAGLIHGVYAALAAWIFLLAFLDPEVGAATVAFVAFFLSIFFFMGAVSFRRPFTIRTAERIQITVEIASLWLVAFLRLALT